MDGYIAWTVTKVGQTITNLTTFSHFYAHIWSY